MFDDVLFATRRPIRPTVETQFAVDVVSLSSGAEHRNARTGWPKRRYILPVGPRPLVELEAIMSFFAARGGPLRAFRYRDPFLYSTSASGAETPFDVEIGTGDASAITFQMKRNDAVPLTKPILGTVRVAVDGVELTPDTQFTADTGTGLITLASPPSANAVVTAGSEFDIPVRFENETLAMTQSNDGVGAIDDLRLIEVAQ
ncbi:MAG: DUF2460 domain-containing protein [Pseudomonadota bacterium]